MLQLRPGCEHCDKDLPPESTEAMICTYECTFCRDCVALLENVCPNCGGAFHPRPHRPRHPWRAGVTLANNPASSKRVHKPVDLAAHKLYAARIKAIPSHER